MKSGLIIIICIFLAIIAWIVYSQVRENHLQKDEKLLELREKLKDLHPAIHDIKLLKGDKSYTINKEKVYLCLRDEHGEYYPDNFLVYVLTHELSHVINKKDVGHTEEFHRIFDELLIRAEELGIYDPNEPKIQDYCTYNDKK